ncbi:MAG: hypothetical protein AABZ08_07705 [Planctomycetota bacterium]
MTRTRLSLRAVLLSGFLPMLIAGTCQRGEISEMGEGPGTDELVKYYSPTAIRILPFTKPRSFDEDTIPDGVSVSLRPLDSAGDPVKAYGVFIFELYGYKAALGNHRGEMIQQWTQPVLGPDAQKRFWERVTSTYEFQLSWEGKPLPVESRYILVASFQSRGATRLFDEYQFEFRPNKEEIINAVGSSKP